MHMVVRSRFAEDTLEESVARGVRQYVILGAGFDSFAYRRPVWASDIRSSRWISRRRRRKNSNG
jgi:O-methyltransferase involved in polyketide biosynthesis